MNDLAYKSFLPDEFNFSAGVRTAALLDEVNGKLYPTTPAFKSASEVDAFVSTIKPDKDHSYIHLISLGAMEWYGPNKRGDGFNEAGGVYTPPAPYSKTAAEVKLDGGLKAYHNSTFKANGKVYREHNSIVANKNAKPLGDVVFAIYNEPMHRGELIIKLANAEWHDDIDRISKGKPVYFSMGALCPNDVCSWCGKRTSPNDRKNRCEHLTRETLSYKPDGTQVVAITDSPIFYDISRVARPADKIAFSLAKVASEAGMAGVSPCPQGVMSASLLDRIQHHSGVDRLALLMKVASEEKMCDGTKVPISLPDEEDEAILKGISEKDVPKVLFVLKKNKTLLPYPHFIKMLGGTGPEIDAALPLIGEQLPGIFNNILSDDDLNGFLDDGTYDGEEDVSADTMIKLMPIIAKYALNDEPIQRRVTKVIIIPSSKLASDVIFTPRAVRLASKLAKEYARYQLSFLTENRDHRDIRLTLAHNHADVLA